MLDCLSIDPFSLLKFIPVGFLAFRCFFLLHICLALSLFLFICFVSLILVLWLLCMFLFFILFLHFYVICVFNAFSNCFVCFALSSYLLPL